MTIEKIEHLKVGDRRVVRIVWRHPLSAMANCIKGPPMASWDRLVSDWMPAETAKELATAIAKVLKTRPKVVKIPKAKAAAAPAATRR